MEIKSNLGPNILTQKLKKINQKARDSSRNRPPVRGDASFYAAHLTAHPFETTFPIKELFTMGRMEILLNLIGGAYGP